MADLTMTYGVMPTRAELREQFRRRTPDGFHFGNDERVGNQTLTFNQLYKELEAAVKEFRDGDEDAGRWASDVLSVLMIEWI